jgi:hypothetical protein
LADPVDFSNSKREYLEFTEQEAYRDNFTGDTYLLPPELPVIAHSIKHWSGVRKNGSTAVAHTGFPLNIGKYKKLIRRTGSTGLNVDDYVEYETNRLARVERYRRQRPGRNDIAAAAATDAADDGGAGA